MKRTKKLVISIIVAIVSTIILVLTFKTSASEDEYQKLIEYADYIVISTYTEESIDFTEWSDEFMKLLQFIKNDLEIVRGREEVYQRLIDLYNPSKANLLFNFYCSIQLNGLKDVKLKMSSTTYYRNIKFLKEAKVDFSQSYKVEERELFYFNPFEYKEVV